MVAAGSDATLRMVSVQLSIVVDDPSGGQLRRFVASSKVIYSDIWDCFLCVPVPATWDVAEHVIDPFRQENPWAIFFHK